MTVPLPKKPSRLQVMLHVDLQISLLNFVNFVLRSGCVTLCLTHSRHKHAKYEPKIHKTWAWMIRSLVSTSTNKCALCRGKGKAWIHLKPLAVSSSSFFRRVNFFNLVCAALTLSE